MLRQQNSLRNSE